ncbi:protein phosphatase CheZ [Hyphomicrobiales bacterium 4NK60-0047b]
MSRAFRIERYIDPSDEQSFEEDNTDKRHKEIMDTLSVLQKSISQGVSLKEGDTANSEKVSNLLTDEVEEKREELNQLRHEMGEIYKAIHDTKTQIMTIKESGADGHEMARAAEELSLIVKGTEEATNNILHAAETVETNAGNLVASLQDESQQALACEIQEQTVGIFEACNFQDLTGQRITKVVKTFCFIEARILKMIEIWGGPDKFLGISAEELESRQGDNALLNGPALMDEESIANQDDIDALFD